MAAVVLGFQRALVGVASLACLVGGGCGRLNYELRDQQSGGVAPDASPSAAAAPGDAALEDAGSPETTAPERGDASLRQLADAFAGDSSAASNEDALGPGSGDASAGDATASTDTAAIDSGSGDLDGDIASSCGDGLCSTALGEGCASCPIDCTIDQSQPMANSSTGALSFDQSFVAGATGELWRIDTAISGLLGATTATLTPFEGGVCPLGPCGPEVYTEVVPVIVGDNAFVLTAPLPVVSSQADTWQIITGSQINAPVQDDNPYPNGESLPVGFPNHDAQFTTYVTTCL